MLLVLMLPLLGTATAPSDFGLRSMLPLSRNATSSGGCGSNGILVLLLGLELAMTRTLGRCGRAGKLRRHTRGASVNAADCCVELILPCKATCILRVEQCAGERQGGRVMSTGVGKRDER